MPEFSKEDMAYCPRRFSAEEKLGHEITVPWQHLCARVGLAFQVRSTGVLVALCPVHCERTASFHMWPKSERSHCHGCGWDGDKIDFLTACFSLSSIEEVEKILKGDAGYTPLLRGGRGWHDILL